MIRSCYSGDSLNPGLHLHSVDETGLISAIVQVRKQVRIGAGTCLRSHSQSAGWSRDSRSRLISLIPSP